MTTKKTKTKTTNNVKTEKFVTQLKVQLTTQEIADRADRAAAMIADRDNKEEELKAHSKHQKSIIEQIDAEMRLLQSEVRNRSTYRQVECERQYDFNAGKYREVRLDTFETVNERKLLESERQMELPFNGEGDEGEEDGAEE